MFYHRFSIDGEDIWSLAQKHGVIEKVPFNPEVHDDPAEDAEAGDDWWVIAQDDAPAPDLAPLVRKLVEAGDAIEREYRTLSCDPTHLTASEADEQEREYETEPMIARWRAARAAAAAGFKRERDDD